MTITKYHRLHAAAKWDWTTNSWFPIVNVLLEDKCIHVRMIRRGRVVRSEAIEAANELISEALKMGRLLV